VYRAGLLARQHDRTPGKHPQWRTDPGIAERLHQRRRSRQAAWQGRVVRHWRLIQRQQRYHARDTVPGSGHHGGQVTSAHLAGVDDGDGYLGAAAGDRPGAPGGDALAILPCGHDQQPAAGQCRRDRLGHGHPGDVVAPVLCRRPRAVLWHRW
jgi:hypothetical protein